MKDEILSKLKKIQLLVLDFDGVLTDNRVFVDKNGVESVACNRSDSLGIELLRESKNIDTIVISKEKNAVVKARCSKLSIECYSGINDKLELLERISNDKNISLINIAYIGNDSNDVSCMENVGISVAVNDSHETAISVADILLNKKGGYGAVREFIDMLLAQ
ncbi:KdsC family phosphatase [Methanoplanus limicola]|uniref:3-deoxy-D-manno-octulosonate 8-phosphate phosphatase, YrbI family n=1 Tax=Methanoplanus limicola DSM 2279 TaxID=937775 RepID=H1YXB7_9EURY|nr:HAD hydrolase family protein [Methanoplanus limicola]EHQ36854.1 3-deoxy-D-manno-octulosonate 8-phosphate phosphatase, YrbI family [Methanoplanus limicola DSM 2279]